MAPSPFTQFFQVHLTSLELIIRTGFWGKAEEYLKYTSANNFSQSFAGGKVFLFVISNTYAVILLIGILVFLQVNQML